MKKRFGNLKGFTLVEIMVATVILSVVSLSLIGAMGNFGKVVTSSREMTLATHLAQEKVESLRSLTFYQIMVTSTAVLNNNFSPPLQYDNGYYPPETIRSGGISYTRHVFVEKTDTPTGVVENVGYPHPDTGLKRINVFVTWQRPDGEWKKLTVSNLASNPAREALDRRIYGYVTNSVSGLPVSGALIQARRNPGWGAYTDNNGYYSFQATDATMILIGERYAYNGYTSASFNINYGDNLMSFSMVPTSSRTVTGYVITYSGLLISQVNSKWSASSTDEFIELYNGSTNTINFEGYTLTYVDSSDAQTVISTTSWLTTSIASHTYFMVLGNSLNNATAANGRAADAVYVPLLNEATQGGVILKDPTGTTIDSVAWGNSVSVPPVAAREGDGYNLGASAGVAAGTTLIRKCVSTSTVANMTPNGGAHINLGNAWDTQNNIMDFLVISTANPRNYTFVRHPMGGTGLSSATVSAEDGLSAMVLTSSSGYFSNVYALGTWLFVTANPTWEGARDTAVTSGGPNTALILSTTPVSYGFISGQVKQYGTTPFPNMLVQADPGGIQAMSDAAGRYVLALPAGEDYFITGNPNFYDPDWNTAVTPDAISVTAGAIVSNIELNIWKNAYVSGRVTTNGVDGLPGVAVVASGQFSNGNTAMTDGNGNYTISGLRLIGNPYTIFPALVEGQSASPASYTGVDLTQGNNLTGQDFQVSGAFVTITGTATYNGQPITSGVNIIASTNTINSASPPDITFAVRNGSTKYFQAITDGSGRYSLSVVGGNTYNLIGWYTTTSTTSAKTLSVTVASNIGNSSSHLTWP